MKRWLMVLGLLAAGCGDVEVTLVAGRGSLDEEILTLQVGEASGLELELDEDENSRMSSSDPAIVDVAPGVDPHTFVVFGVSPGEAQLLIEVDGEVEDALRAQVTARE